ncbi:5'-3' exonuclease [Texas Phoenix palm phytoplasma]|uniref:5'-3' exonuclease n=1 Tax=Texas Phoenix palm phytoplasma TaxID=176709 RepID=A0ABS5BIV2_9MOLU|nr:5'-3' exonuclease H3TH domain-containing protein [Texas Phoenix palm phytoplasma]MBP3059513.1 5'-3' exonuclease [Texas Phoenix palm phytoplasma]
MKKLILIDGNSLIFRAYYATCYKKNHEMQNSQGQDVNALIVFIQMFKKILEQNNQKNYICVAFDLKTKTKKHELCQKYKKNRPTTPDSLIQQIKMIQEYLFLSGIKYYSQENYEADDIIGTLAKQASNDNIPVLIFSSDKDFLQLIDENIHVCLIKQGLSRTIYYDIEKLWKEYQLKPNQIIDFKSLVGDKSDNIEGVFSIGPKTASKLLNKFDNLENIFNNLEKIDVRIKKKLIEYKKKVFFNRLLVSIDKNVPLNFNYNQTKIKKYCIFALNDFLQKNKIQKNNLFL